jgi:prephenate dehydrogenase
MTGETGKKQTLGIIGLGAFGRFMARHLGEYFCVKGYDRTPPAPGALAAAGAEKLLAPAPLEEVAACDIVVFAVPLESLRETVDAAVPHLRDGALVLDVTSVKMRPVEILASLPGRVEALGMHPLFGPQSGKDGIRGMRVALCPVRIGNERYYKVCDFLTEKLGLLCLRTTPEQHDREMARVQAMTHFMSRALKKIGLQPSPMATRAYEKLQEFSAIVLSDSWDLFLTIQNGNPFAEEMRQGLLRELHELEDGLTAPVPPPGR